jgi:hypothetical protein
VVCAEAVPALEGGELEAGNSKGKKVANPTGFDTK